MPPAGQFLTLINLHRSPVDISVCRAFFVVGWWIIPAGGGWPKAQVCCAGCDIFGAGGQFRRVSAAMPACRWIIPAFAGRPRARLCLVPLAPTPGRTARSRAGIPARRSLSAASLLPSPGPPSAPQRCGMPVTRWDYPPLRLLSRFE